MRVLLGFLCGVALAGAYVYFTAKSPRSVQVPRETTPVVTGRGPVISPVRQSPRAAVAVPKVQQANSLILAVRLEGPDAWDELLLVENGQVRSLPLPEGIDQMTFPVTDGQRLYAYTAPRGGEPRGRRLVAFSLAGREEETVTDSTRLVEPRGLFASLNGTAFAYFLDARTSGKTELWVYDTVRRTKRVVIERLTRGGLHGPFFSPDGTILVHDGNNFLLTTQNRTGADPLSLPVRAADIDWRAGVLRSPDGQRLALVVSEGGIEFGTRIVAYRVGGTAGQAPLRPSGSAGQALASVERGHTSLLRWTAEEGVVFAVDAEGEKPPVVLSVTPGNVPRSVSLSSGSFGPILSGSARTVVGIRGGGYPVIEETDLLSGISRVLSAIPIPPGAYSGEPAWRLVQVLSSAAQPLGDALVVGALPAEVVAKFMTTNLRAITDAPSGEPAVAERLWVLRQPRAYYLDYRIGTTLWRRLVSLEGDPEVALRFTIRGVFAPVQGEWAITRGEGAADPTPVALYEYEPEANQWVQKHVPTHAGP